MRDDTGTWLGGAVRVGATFLLAGVGLAATTAVALVTVPGETATAVVTVAPFIVAPPLAAAAGLVVTRGDARTAALAGGIGSLGGGYLLSACALATLVAIAGASGVVGLVGPLLVAGAPTAVVGAGSGYLRVRSDTESDHTAPTESIVDEPATEPPAEPSVDEPTVNEPPRDATTTDGGSEPLADTDTAGDATAMSAPSSDDPSPGAVDIDAWADDRDDTDEEIKNLDDLFAKTPDPVADDRD